MIKGAGIGAGIVAILTFFWKVIKFVAEVIAKLIIYLGLWAPLLYLAYGGILMLIYKDFHMFSMDTNSIIYFVGLILCLIISVIITIKNLIVKPFKKIFSRKDVIQYGDKDERKLKRNMPEAPKIYNSRVNPGVIVYEYKNRYDLYEEHDNQLFLVATEYKKGKHGRKSRE